MTLPDIDVAIRPDSTFIISGTAILGSVQLGPTFLLGPVAAALVSIVGQVTQVEIHRGRTRSTNSFDTASASVTFVDTTGQFNPDNTSSPLYPYVLPLRQIRISATVSGVPYQLFNGYTTRYTYQYEPSFNATWVTIEAEDAFRTLSSSSVETITGATYAELSGSRVGRILTQLQVPTSIRDIDAGNTQVADDSGSVRTGLEAIQQVEETELGAFFIDKRGFHTFRSRQNLQLLAGGVIKKPLEFDETTGLPFRAIQVGYDDQNIVNYVTIDGDLLTGAVASDATSITEYFNRTFSKTGSLLITDTEATNQANYLVGFRKDPKVTIDSLDFDVRALSSTTRTNLCTNPSFETNTTGWSTYNTVNTRASWTISGGSGSWSLIATATSTNTNGPFFNFTPTVGQTLTFSAQCLRTSGSRSYVARFEFYNGATIISAPAGTASTCATSTRLSVTATVPATATNAYFMVYSTGSGSVGDAIQIDSVLLEQASTVGTYFDGDTSFRTSWTGTAHGSRSLYESDQQLVVDAELLDPLKITKKYSGSSDLVRTLTIQGINHSITPGSWNMTFEVAEPLGGDGFILDSTISGILDTNILVY